MSEAEILELKKGLAEAQEKLCEQRHKTIDDTLRELKDSMGRLLWWLIGTMGGILTTLIVVILKK
jgi:hypothetical protein